MVASKQAAFLAAYAEVGNITHAAEIAGLNRETHHKWMKVDPTYPERFKTADEQAVEKLEQEARRRAVTGVRRKKFTGKGEPVIDPVTGEQYIEEEYSDTLLIFLMKGARPEKYKDRVHQQTDLNIVNWQGLVKTLEEGANTGTSS